MNERYWRKEGQRVARRVNAALWLERFSLPAALLGLVWGGAILFTRRYEPDALRWVHPVGACLLGLIALEAWWHTRRKWCTEAEGLVRLEWVYGLHNALSSAAAGVLPWPEPLPTPADGRLRWRLPRTLAPLLLGVLLVAGAWKIPLSHAEEPEITVPKEEPLAWKKTEETLARLEEEKVVEPESIRPFAEKLEALRSQPQEAWYTQSLLEASDNLQQETAAAAARMAEQLAAAAEALRMEKIDPQNAASLWKEAMGGLKDGALQPDAALAEALKKAMQEGISRLSPAELEALREQLQKAADGAREGTGTLQEALAALRAKQGEGDAQLQQGPGGPGPGGDHVPLHLRESSTPPLNPNETLPLSSDDTSRLALGDKMESLPSTPPDAPPQETPTQRDGGAITSPGAGGEAVWNDRLRPDEQAVLRRFFATEEKVKP